MADDAPTRYWPKRVRAAYLWILGWKQVDIADEVNRSPSTIRKWKMDDTWNQAIHEAEGRWLTEVMREARQTVLQAIKEGDQELAFEIIQRRDDRVRPREERVNIDADVRVDRQDARERLANRLARATTGTDDAGSPVGSGRNGGGGS